MPGLEYVCVAVIPDCAVTTVPSPKLKMTFAIGVWSVSVDPLASAVTVNADTELTDSVRTPTGAKSGAGVGVLVGVLVGALVGTLEGRGAAGLADARADGAALDAAWGGGDSTGAVGSGVVVTARTCADAAAAGGRWAAIRWACSIRVNTKKGNAIATTRTVAPIEKSGKRVRSKPPIRDIAGSAS